MISQTAEYALRAAICLASADGEAMTAQEMSVITLVPQPYLAKVMRSLARAGVVTSQRGMKGGFRLSSPADKVTIYEVINAVEPFQRIQRCPLGLPGHVKLCPLHKRVDAALEQVEQAFRASTLGELLREKTTSIPLCDHTPPTL